MKTGLVLEGGAMRGLYTAGVLDVFLENGIESDGVIGVSAGAIHGCSYVSKQLGRSIRYYCKYSKYKNFMSWYSFFTTGDIVNRKFCYDDLPNRLDPFDNKTFMDSNQEFYATVTNCNTGKAEYLKCDDLDVQIDYLRASASMPIVSHMVELNGQMYLDGGMSDSVPLKAFENMGYDKNIVVLTRPKGYRKKTEHAGIMKLVYRKYPKLVETMASRAKMYNETMDYIEKLEDEGKIIVIRPSEKNAISRMEKDPEKLKAWYDVGRKDALAILDKIKMFYNI